MTSFKIYFYFIVFLSFNLSLTAQTITVFSESFNEVGISGTSAEGIGWNIDCPSCGGTSFVQSDGSQFVAQESNGTPGPASFISDPIDISMCSKLHFRFDYSASLPYPGNGNMEALSECPGCNGNPLAQNAPCTNCWDFIYAVLEVDGSPISTQTIGLTTASAQSGFVEFNPPCFVPGSKQEAVIKIYVQTITNDEIYFIDNVILECIRTEVENIVVSPAALVCEGDDVQLSVSGSWTNFQWSGPNGFSSTSANPVINNITSDDAGVYYLISTDLSNCANIDSVVVAVRLGPQAEILGGAQLCQGECSIIDVYVVGGVEPFSLNMTLQVGSFPPFTFNAAGFSFTDEFFICYESSVFAIPQYNAGTKTLSLPASFAGFTATFTLNSVGDNSGCPGTVSNIPLEFEFYEQPQANAAFLEACDEGGGIATFDLNNAIGGILGSETGDVRLSSDLALNNEETSPYVGPSGQLYAIIESPDGCISVPEILTLTVLPPGNVGNVFLQCATGTQCTICDDDGVSGEMVDITINLPDNSDYNIEINYLVNGNPQVFSTTVTGPTAVLPFNINGNAIFTLSSVMEVGQCPDITGLGTNVQITYQLAPDVLPVNPLVSCNEVVLPPIQVVNPGSVTGYFTQPNGAGVQLSPGDIISSTTQLYAYSGNAQCFDQELQLIEIGGLTTFDQPHDTTRCGEFILPAILGTNVSATASYYTNSGGSGTAFVPGDTIRSSQTLYVFDASNPLCLTNQPSFVITIVPAPIIKMDSLINACVSFTLPKINGTGLLGDEAYYSNPNFTGMPDTVGTVIMVNDTFYISAGQGTCKDTDTLYVSISPNTIYDTIVNVSACNGYILLPITGQAVNTTAAYYTQPMGMGAIYHPGDEISSPITLFVYDTLNRCQTNFISFDIQVAPGPEIAALQSVTACQEYTLPPITGLNLSANVAYYTAPNGGGTKLLPGDKVNTTTILYAYDQGVNCSTQQPFDVTIEVKPNAGDPLVLSKCIEENLTLNLFDLLSGNYQLNGTWQASGPTVLDVSNPNSVSIPPNAAPGNYAFRYTINSVACGPSISLPNLSLSKAPDAGVGAITNACQSGLGSINLFNYLTGNANNAGTWSSPEYSISTPTTFNANQMAAGTHKFYYHTSANAGNGLVCKDSADVVFNIAAASNAGQDATTTVCKGQQVNLVALLTGATSTGVFKDPASSGGLSGSTFNSSAVNAGTFSILHILPAQNGCLADTSKINVTVEAKPNAGADLSVSRCDLNAVDLKPLVAANPNGNFSLAAGAGSLNNGVLTPSGPGQFKVLYIAGDGQPCPKDTAVIDLNMAVRPPAALQSIPSFCQGDEVLVNFTGQPGILYSLIVQNQTQFNSGNVNNNLFGSIFLLLTSQQTIKLNPALFEPGITYHVSIVEIETTDCDFTLSPGVIQTTFVISPATLTNQNGSICRGETVTIGTVIFDENHTKDTIRYSSATGCDSLVSYNFALLDSSVYNYVFSTCDQNYTYTVNGKSFNKATPVGRVKLNVPNSQGCDSIVSVALSFTVPTAQFQTQNAPCEDATGSVNILQSSLVPASLYLNGVLTEQLTSLPKLLVLEPGVYNLEIRDANGCTTTQSISIGTDPSPDFSVVEAQNNGQSILSIQPAFDFTSIQWQPAGQVVSPQAAITAVTGYGLFTADLEYSPGCFTQVSYLIEKTVVKDIYWPNTLDPDLPGNNLFFPVKSDDYIVDLTSIEIYDRWGNRLFLRENAVWGQADQGWDGTFNGKNVTPGVYVFVLNLKETDGKTRSIVGDITITR